MIKQVMISVLMSVSAFAFADNTMMQVTQNFVQDGTAKPVLGICQNVVNAHITALQAMNPDIVISQSQQTALLNACISGQNISSDNVATLQAQPLMTQTSIQDAQVQMQKTPTQPSNQNIY